MKATEKPKRREPTPAQKEAAKQRREHLKALTKQIESDPPSGSIETIEGHPLSDMNAALVLAQCPPATVVGGFGQWKKHGRQVKKGEKGLAIWFPCKTKQEDDDATDKSRMFFRVGTVFDISQTEISQTKPAASEAAMKPKPSKRDLLSALTF